MTQLPLTPAGPADALRGSRHRLRAWGLLIVLFAAAIGPTLTWVEFSGGSENLLVATAMEVRRGGQWLVPTLMGRPRIVKPPLPMWLSAAAIRPHTLARVGQPSLPVRNAAFQELAWQVRWPGLLLACILLGAVYELGSVLRNGRTGLMAALICGSSFLFLRHARAAGPDIPLALFVTLANVFIARTLFRGAHWRDGVLAGLCLGLAFMSKGPVSILQTLAPAVAFAAWSRWSGAASPAPAPRGRWLRLLLPGGLAFAALALPWFLYVLAHVPHAMRFWGGELTAEDGSRLPPGHWYNTFNYLAYLPALFLPWTPWLIGGLYRAIVACRRAPSDRDRRMVFALALLAVPIFLMSFNPDRKDRYLLPVIPAAAILSAIALAGAAPLFARRDRLALTLRAAHLVILLAILLGLPLAGWLALKTTTGTPWYTPQIALGSLFLGVALLLALWPDGINRPRVLLGITVLIMLLAQGLLMAGYCDSADGRAEMRPLADRIWMTCPSAAVYNYRKDDRSAPLDLAIYLDRVISQTADPGSLAPAGVPQVYVQVQRSRETPPAAAPGWTWLGRAPRDNDWIHAFHRPASRQPPAPTTAPD